jgi:hypothetical protein
MAPTAILQDSMISARRNPTSPLCRATDEDTKCRQLDPVETALWTTGIVQHAFARDRPRPRPGPAAHDYGHDLKRIRRGRLTRLHDLSFHPSNEPTVQATRDRKVKAFGGAAPIAMPRLDVFVVASHAPALIRSICNEAPLMGAGGRFNEACRRYS